MDTAMLVSAQRRYFESGATRPAAFRSEALKRLLAAIEEREDALIAALGSDLNKCPEEAYMTELGLLKSDLRYAIKHLRSWSRPKRVPPSLGQFPAKCSVIPEPYGVSLIMSPWNYPVLLTLEPLIGALAAGNTAIVKPSAYSPAVSKAVAALISSCFDAEYCAVVEGGRLENKSLLEQHFDYIFFTGGAAVGREVMAAAAKRLTPVSLELGGKSPVIIEQSADIDLAAKRIAFGKFINAGQTCVAPDYVLIPRSLKGAFISAMRKWIDGFYPAGPSGAIEGYPRIVNEKHFERLCGLMSGADIAIGGVCDRASLAISPTVLDNVSLQDPVMGEEIFGPLLPVIECESVDEAVSLIRARPRLLALYLFTRDKAVKKRVLSEISFGGGCVNDVIMHVASHKMPFGGVGESGMGAYHGKYSFDAFTHLKSVMDRAARPDIAARYRPFDGRKRALMRFM